MRASALAVIVGFGLAWANGALAQDVVYPFEDSHPVKPKSASKRVAKPATTPLPVARPEMKVETKAETKPEAKPEAKTEAKVEPKPETKAGAKVEAKADPKPEPKLESKSPTKPAAKSDTAANTLPGVSAEERVAIGWNIVLDPATGIRLGLPAKWVPQSKPTGTGTHWSSRHGDIQVRTFRLKVTEPINKLFDKERREPASRKVETSALKGDGFTITGLQGLKKFGVRAQLKNGELRGYTVLYDQMMEGIVAPITAAMATSFAPFPDSVAPIATLSKPVDYGTGVIVSSEGHVLTDRRLADNCSVIAVAGLGNAERIAVDRQSALALLRIYGKRDLTAAAIADAAPSGEFTLAGIPDPHIQDGGKKLEEVKAQLGDGNAIRLRDPVPLGGLSGAAALDAKGRVVGVMETRNAQLASAETGLPPVRLIPAGTIRSFLTSHNVSMSQSAADARTAVVRVICVLPRK